MRLKSQAVLFRTSSHSATLEVELTRRNIPFVKFGGLKFLEAAHIKDVLAALRWAHNLRDRVAGFRVAQLLPGIGPGTAAKLLDGIATSWTRSGGPQGFRPPVAAAAALAGFRRDHEHAASRRRRLAGRARSRVPLVFAVHGTALSRTRRNGRRTSRSLHRSPRVIRRASAS